MMTPRPAAFLAIGSELLRAQRLDTNSLIAATVLNKCGYRLVEKRCVEDDEDAIAQAVAGLSADVDLLLVSGGLGPTADDVTRAGVARALGREVVRSPELLAALHERYRKHGRKMPAVGERMADIVAGAEVLHNPEGTAPGQLLAGGRCTIVLLPGVPKELQAILSKHILPRWQSSQNVVVRTLHLTGVYESAVEQRVTHLYERFGRHNVTILAARGRVDFVLIASGDDALARVAEMESAFVEAAGDDLAGQDDETLDGVVIELLRRRSWRLATAESCTGGLLGWSITSVPGASDVYVGGVVAYSNELKQKLLGVPEQLLIEHGAVSQPVAEAMAVGARKLGAEIGVGITGIAGPTGGTDERPVGTVHIAVATPDEVRHARHRYPGDRAAIREYSVSYALDMVRRALRGR